MPSNPHDVVLLPLQVPAPFKMALQSFCSARGVEVSTVVRALLECPQPNDPDWRNDVSFFRSRLEGLRFDLPEELHRRPRQ